MSAPVETLMISVAQAATTRFWSSWVLTGILSRVRLANNGGTMGLRATARDSQRWYGPPLGLYAQNVVIISRPRRMSCSEFSEAILTGSQSNKMFVTISRERTAGEPNQHSD